MIKNRKYSFVMLLVVILMNQGCEDNIKLNSAKARSAGNTCKSNNIAQSLTLLANPDKNRYIGNSTLSRDLAKQKPFITLHLH